MRSTGAFIVALLLQSSPLLAARKGPPSQAPASFEAMQIAALETGFAFGTKTGVIALPVGLRSRSFSGIAYDSDAISAALRLLGTPDPQVQKTVTIISETSSNPDSKAASAALLDTLNQLKKTLEARGDALLATAMRIGFVLGTAAEIAAVSLSTKPQDSDMPKIDATLGGVWSPLKSDVEVANLPIDLKAKLPRVALKIRTVNDLRDLRDKCYDFWDACRRRAKAPGKTAKEEAPAAGWTEHRHPHGFTFSFPAAWKVQDDESNKAAMLLPPGVTIEGPGPKALFLLSATRGYADASATKPYFQSQLGKARIAKYWEEPLPKNIGHGAILHWKGTLSETSAPFDFSVLVLIIKEWAVHISIFGPEAVTAPHEATIRQIAKTIKWK